MLDHTCRQLRPHSYVGTWPSLTQTRLARAPPGARARGSIDESKHK